MFFYIFLFTVVIFTSLCFPQSKKLGVFWLIVLCFLSMFRAASVGTDTFAYMDVGGMLYSYGFNSGDSLFGKSSELITVALYLIMYYYSLPPRLAIIFFSLLTFFFLYLSLKKLKLSYCIGVVTFLVFFYLSSFNIARQICACSIILYASTYLIENTRRYLFFVFVALASFIHAASILGVVLFFVSLVKKLPFSRKQLTYIAIVLFIFNMVSPFNVVEMLVSLFSNISFAETYSDIAMTESRSVMGLIQDAAKFFVAILIFNYGDEDREMTFMDWLYYCTIIATIFSANMHSDVARAFLPIEFLKVLYIPYQYEREERFLLSKSYWSFMFVSLFFTLWGVSIGNGEVVPYILSVSF